MKKKYFILIIIILMVSITLIAIGTFAIGTWKIKNDDSIITTGTIKFNYTENISNIAMTNTYPISDDEGKTLEFFEFNLSTEKSNNTDIGYYIYVTPDEKNTLKNEDIKIYLTKVTKDGQEEEIIKPTLLNDFTRIDTKTITIDNASKDLLIYKDYFKTENKETYRLRLWIKDNYIEQASIEDGKITIDEKTFNLKVNIIGVNEKPKEISK